MSNRTWISERLQAYDCMSVFDVWLPFPLRSSVTSLWNPPNANMDAGTRAVHQRDPRRQHTCESPSIVHICKFHQVVRVRPSLLVRGPRRARVAVWVMAGCGWIILNLVCVCWMEMSVYFGGQPPSEDRGCAFVPTRVVFDFLAPYITYFLAPLMLS